MLRADYYFEVEDEEYMEFSSMWHRSDRTRGMCSPTRPEPFSSTNAR